MFWHRSLVQISTIIGLALLTASVSISKGGSLREIAKIDSTESLYLTSKISRDLTILAKENQRRIALVIGNSNYREQGKLPNPANDANDMDKALSELGFEVIKVVDADKKAMDTALEKFAVQLNRGGVGLFYYAGHGVQVNGENYLIPVDAVLNSEKDVNYEALPIGKIQNAMEEAGTDVSIIILDACRSNPFGRRWNRSTQNQGLAPIQALTGSFIAFATAPGNSAEDGTGKNGTFTSYILKYIQTPNLSIEDLFKKVRQGVSNETEKRQIPWDSSSLIGDFSFKLQQTTVVVNTSTPQPTNTPTPLPSDLEARISPNGIDNLSIDALAKLGKQITVTIENFEDKIKSSGVIIDRQSNIYTVLTTKFAVAKGKKYRLTTIDGTRYNVSNGDIKLTDNTLDLAIIKFTSDRNYTIAKLGDSTKIQEGAIVYKAGYTQLLDNLASDLAYTFKSASLVSIVSSGDSQNGYQLIDNNPLTAGSGGGAILNVKGLLVGIQGRAIYDGSTQKSLGVGIPIEQYLNNKNRFNTIPK
jgi:S1-C subfamily serine protease